MIIQYQFFLEYSIQKIPPFNFPYVSKIRLPKMFEDFCTTVSSDFYGLILVLKVLGWELLRYNLEIGRRAVNMGILTS